MFSVPTAQPACRGPVPKLYELIVVVSGFEVDDNLCERKTLRKGQQHERLADGS
jgi:hypothetical protein